MASPAFRGGTAPAPSFSRRSRYRPSRLTHAHAHGHEGGHVAGSAMERLNAGLLGLSLGGGAGANAAGGAGGAGGDQVGAGDSSDGTGTMLSMGRSAGTAAFRSQPSLRNGAAGPGSGGAGNAGGSDRAEAGRGSRQRVHRGLTSRRNKGVDAGGIVDGGVSGSGGNGRRGQSGASGLLFASGTALGGGPGGGGSGAAATKNGTAKAGRRRRHGSARRSRQGSGDKRHLIPIPRISSAHYSRSSGTGAGDAVNRRERMSRLMDPAPAAMGPHVTRPPSRQKTAFPTHLSEFDSAAPKAAFTSEAPAAAKVIGRRVDDSPRPPSRHKPPPQALFLEVPAGSSAGARRADDLVLMSPGTLSPGRVPPGFGSAKPRKPSLGGSSSTGGIAMFSKSKKRAAAAASNDATNSRRLAAWDAPSTTSHGGGGGAGAGAGAGGGVPSSDSDGDSDGFGHMPVTYNIPIEVSGANSSPADSQRSGVSGPGDDADVSAGTPPQPDMPPSWLRRSTATAPSGTSTSSHGHGAAYLLDDSFDSLDVAQPPSARLSNVETADAEMRRWERQMARKYRVGADARPWGVRGASRGDDGGDGAAAASSSSTSAAGLVLGGAAGASSLSGSLSGGAADAGRSPRGDAPGAAGGGGGSSASRGVAARNEERLRSTYKPRAGRSRRPRSGSLTQSASRRAHQNALASSRLDDAASLSPPVGAPSGTSPISASISITPLGTNGTVFTGAASTTASKRPKSSRRMGRQRSARAVLESSPSSASPSPVRAVAEPRTRPRELGSLGHSITSSPFGTANSNVRAGRRKRQAGTAPSGAIGIVGAGGSGVVVGPAGGGAGGTDNLLNDTTNDSPARLNGHGAPPVTPLALPFNSTLSQDFLDLFAHSIPSPGRPSQP